jgi:hypothetical protein
MALHSQAGRPRDKPVLLAVIDALATRVVLPAFERGDLPNLRRLTELGVMRPESTAIFPSITPAATAALITGGYPRDHGIAGAYWYDSGRDEVAYFGDDFWVILEHALSPDQLRRREHRTLLRQMAKRREMTDCPHTSPTSFVAGVRHPVGQGQSNR